MAEYEYEKSKQKYADIFLMFTLTTYGLERKTQ